MNGAFEYRKWAGDKVNGLFDHYLAKVAQAEGLWTVMPVIARTQNIGLEAGEHSTPETFATDYNARGAWDFELHEYLGEWKLGGADESV